MANPRWTVTGQQQSERLTDGGAFESVVRVNFALASGTKGSVVIPSRLYSEEYVRAQIDATASAMAAVEGLKG